MLLHICGIAADQSPKSSIISQKDGRQGREGESVRDWCRRVYSFVGCEVSPLKGLCCSWNGQRPM